MSDEEAIALKTKVETLERQLARKTDEVRILQTISTEINSTLQIDRIFEQILSSLDAAFGFRHAMILLPADGDACVRVVASRGYAQPGLGATIPMGQGVIGMVAKKRRFMRMVAMGVQKHYADTVRESLSQAGVPSGGERATLPGLPDARSQMAIPLIAKDRLIGVLSVESPEHNAFDSVDELTATVVGSQIATAIDNASAYDAQARLFEACSRFVPRELLEILGKKSILEVKLGDQLQRDMVVLFSDIRSFTSMSEKMAPKENFEFINAFLHEVAPVIRESNGFIDKYIGDAIMALFGGEVDDAVRAGIGMQKRVREFNQHRAAAPVRIGVGIHVGSLILGIVGFADRMEGTVIADSVNLASRLEGVTKEYAVDIVVSEPAMKRLAKPGDFHTRFLGAVHVKGKAEAVRIYDVFDVDAPEQIALKVATRATFEEGVALFETDRESAAKKFAAVLAANPKDAAATAYLERARRPVETRAH